jgi:hypothetical protein
LIRAADCLDGFPDVAERDSFIIHRTPEGVAIFFA